MLKLCYRISDLDIRQLMDVYEETNQISGRVTYPGETANLQTLFAEQDFYQYLVEFFQFPGAVYAVWAEDGSYKAALRLEQYEDGLLITALEGLPKVRQKGYGKRLLKAVVEFTRKVQPVSLYSHVSKQNIPSLALHKKCGFGIVSDKALFLDGSNHEDHYTLSLHKNDPAV